MYNGMISNVLKGGGQGACQPRILYLAKLSLKNKGEEDNTGYPFPISLPLPTQENKRQTLYLLLEETEAGHLITILSPLSSGHTTR